MTLTPSVFLLRKNPPQRSKRSVCIGGRLDYGVSLPCKGEVSAYRQDGRSKPPPYHNLFVSAIEVRLAIIVLKGASRTSPPTNIGVRFGYRGEVTVTLASLV